MTTFPLYRARRSGIALILVVTVLAFVAIVGFSMLSTASMQAQATKNSNHALAADALAESGFDLACYYLVNPGKAPTPVPPGGYWAGGTITFGSSMPGSAEVLITPLATPGDYRLVVIGRPENSQLVRTITSTVRINTGYQVKSIVGFNGSGSLPLTAVINGNVQSNGVLTNLGQILGNVISNFNLLGSGLLGGLLLPADESNKMNIPTAATLRDYSTYTYRGATYTATTITGLPTGTTLGPTPSNPAGVYRYVGPLTMNHNVAINGTLIVEGGDLSISGGGNGINPMDGFPALIVKNNIFIRGPLLPSISPRDLSVNGIVWVGGSLKSTGIMTNAGFNVNGALLFGGSGAVDTLFGARLAVNANANKVANVNIDMTVPPPSAKVLSYKQ